MFAQRKICGSALISSGMWCEKQKDEKPSRSLTIVSCVSRSVPGGRERRQIIV